MFSDRLLGVNRRRHGDLIEMLRALTLYPWLNTAEDEKRRVAMRWVLTHLPGRMRSAPRGAPYYSPAGRCTTPIAVRTCSCPRLQRFDGLTCPHILGAHVMT